MECDRWSVQSADSLLERGCANLEKQQHDAAISLFTEAIRLAPDCGDAFYHRGVARERQGDWEGAIVDYREALARNPGNILANLSLEVVLRHVNGRTPSGRLRMRR